MTGNFAVRALVRSFWRYGMDLSHIGPTYSLPCFLQKSFCISTIMRAVVLDETFTGLGSGSLGFSAILDATPLESF